ncbi:MAG: hypothetical protein P8129_16825 [Anaerolineae bacterium]
MRIRTIVLPLTASLALVVLFLLMAAQADAHPGATADLSLEEAGLNPEGAAYEINLNPEGAAYEINLGPSGHLWISDFSADEIWQVDPTTAAYTVYQGIQAPSDARLDAAGFVWWGDGLAGRFGRLDPTSGVATWWAAPGASSLFGTQIDGNGDLWVVGWDEAYLYRFQPAAGQLCTYTLPLDGIAAYPQHHDGSIWLGDEYNGRLLRLDPPAAQFVIWTLPPDSAPLGMAFDSAGALWYADPNHAYLARFRPDADELDIYDPPTGFLPEMVAARGDSVWYSEHSEGAIGQLKPALASSQTLTLTPTVSSAQVTCNQVMPALTETVNKIQGTLDWTAQTYSLLADSDAWRVYGLPDEGPVQPLPWGVAADAEQIWFVDTGRQVLGRMSDSLRVTACKLADADGDLATTGDQTPVEGWTIYLVVDGQRQEPGQLTGPTGCHVWGDLTPDRSYGVEEQVEPGWKALTPTTYQFGPILPGESHVAEFINVQELETIYMPLVLRRN